MFMANVFNAEQIDGLPLYQKPVQTWNALERAETILQASGADIRHGGDRAYYRPSTDNIQLPDKAQFPAPITTTQRRFMSWATGRPRLAP
jgi:antirestriction protein ArdC